MSLFIGANIATVAKLGFVANGSSALSSANSLCNVRQRQTTQDVRPNLGDGVLT
jgi:hypothetical protein